MRVQTIVDADETGTFIGEGYRVLKGIHATNSGAAIAFLKFFNKATIPTTTTIGNGTDTPVMVLGLPSGGGVSRSFPAGCGQDIFTLGMSIHAMTGAAHTNVTGPGSNEVVVTVEYV